VDGDNVTGASPSDLVKRGLCHIPDPRGIFRSLTVEENLTLQAPRGTAKESIAKAVDVFPRLGERLSQRAGTMSGGEQQMLAVARAYLQDPTVVLLEEIFVFLEKIAAAGTALLLVEQFVHRALALAEQVYVLDRGVIRLTGRASELTEEQIFHSYAGVAATQEVGAK